MLSSRTSLVSLLLLISSVSSLNLAASCVTNYPYESCGGETIYIIDTSSDISLDDINNELSFARNSLVAHINWDESNAAFMSYGSGITVTNPMANSSVAACSMLDTLQTALDNQGTMAVALLQVMQIVKTTYKLDSKSTTNVVLFSGSKDTNDIQAAGEYVSSNLNPSKFSIIQLNNVDFTKLFPAANYWSISSWTSIPTGLAYCIIDQSCPEAQSRCDINKKPADPEDDHSPTLPPITRAHRTTVEIATVATVAPTQKTAPVDGCGECDPTTVWNDVIFLFDSSAASKKPLNDMWVFVQTALSFFNVQKTGYTASNYYTRVGVVVYSDTVETVFPLGSVDLDDLMDLQTLPLLGGGQRGTNIEGAYNASMAQLDTMGRPTARKVIVLMAIDADFGDFRDPQQIVDTFTENLGISVVYNYVPSHGAPNLKLQQLASEGYFLYSPNVTYKDMLQAQCDANCFCTTNFLPYGTDNNRNLPRGGCYYAPEIQSNYQLAGRNCNNSYQNSIVATDKSGDKDSFLRKMLNSQTQDDSQMYLGLYLNTTTSSWLWSDGQVLSTSDYQPWASGSAPTSAAEGQCVVSDDKQKWSPVNCRLPYYYVCQATPCSCHHFCS